VAAPAVPSLVAGAVLGGRYQLDRRLDADDLTERWVAVDQVLDRWVLVEALAPRAGDDARRAFAGAAAAAGRLVHPGIIATYDGGTAADGTSTDGAPIPHADPGHPGIPYVVTERPAGVTLAVLVERQGPLPAHRVVVIGRQLARALDAAHRQRVTHGGVDGEHILVGEDDRAQLVGFVRSGTRARLAQTAPTAASAADASGDAAGPGRDVNALALALAGALVGDPAPSRGGDGAFSARALRPGVPRRLDDVLVAAQPGGTITDAAALATALEALDVADDGEPTLIREPTPRLGTPPIAVPGRRAEPKGRSSALAGVLVGSLLALAAGVGGFVLVRGGSSNPGGTGTSTPGVNADRLAIVGGHSFNPLSPDNPAKTENEQLVNHLYDGDPSTAWSTSEYASRHFGNLKSGTGAYVTLDGKHALRQLTVTSASRGWSAGVYVASSPGPDLAAWGNPVATFTADADVTQVDLHGTSGTAVLVWITDLGPPPDRPDSATTPFRVDIGELALR